MFATRSRREFLGSIAGTGCGGLLAGLFRFAHGEEPTEAARDRFQRRLTLRPLFSPQSPWRQPVSGLHPLPDSQRRVRAVFDILREISLFKLTSELREDWDGQTAEEFKAQLELIEEHGGKAQTPYISCEDFAFPIAPVQRNNGRVVAKELLLQRYEGKERGYPDDSIEVECRAGKLFALNIPQPAYPVRPGGPRRRDVDGNVVLVDVPGRKAYDFWQATTATDDAGASLGGGILGPEILAAGSVSVYDLDGLGAHVPGGPPTGGGRASGLPYLGGLLIPEDLADGERSVIPHALAFTLPRSRCIPDPAEHDPPNFRYPADRTETTAFTVNPYALASGERIRLKPFAQIRGMRYIVLLRSGVLAYTRRAVRRTTSMYVNGQPVVKMEYEFLASDGHRYQGIARTTTPHAVGDDRGEPIVYLPGNPRVSLLLDALPVAWDEGLEALKRSADSDGVFCYTFFKGVGVKQSPVPAAGGPAAARQSSTGPRTC